MDGETKNGELEAEAGLPEDQLDLDMIEIMHPDPEGYLPILRKDPTRKSGIANVTSGKMKDLRTWLPGFVDQLLHDAYMGLNTMHAPRGGSLRKKDMVHKLLSCYVDLDCDDYGLNFKQAFAKIADMIAYDNLPWPSIMASSGNGMYIIWLLNPTEPTENNKSLHRQTCERLIEMTKHLGADPACKDAARIFRLPGSYNTRTGPSKDELSRVKYIPYLASNGELVRYDLDKLFECAALPSHVGDRSKIGERPAKRITAKEVSDPGPRPPTLPIRTGNPLPPGSVMPTNLGQYVDAPHKRASHARILDLVRIAEGRGGISERHREKFLRAYAISLTTAFGHYAGQLAGRVMAMNRRACVPPLEYQEIYYACQKAYAYYMTDKGQPRQLRSDTIASSLAVTAKEAKELDLQTIMPKEERDRRRQLKKRSTRRRARITIQQRTARLAAIRQLTKDKGRAPSLRVLARQYNVSHVTIKNDLKGLGFRVRRDGYIVEDNKE